MKIIPNHYYWMIMHHGDWEKRCRCIHLGLKELAQEERARYKEIRDEKDIPTHQVVFYDFEVYRILEGKIKEETEDVLIIALGGGKEYEFSPFRPMQN